MIIDTKKILNRKRLIAHKKLQDTPYLEIDLGKVRESYGKISKNLDGIEIYYAMKCNPNPDILRTIIDCGGQFEISSANELKKAVAVGADPRKILFSNPVKTEKDIALAFSAGVREFAFDSFSEVDKLAKNAPGSNVYIRLAIPVRKSVVASEGKFGVSLEDAQELVIYAKKMGLKPYGISFHVGSQMLDCEAWGDAIQHCSKLINSLHALGINLTFLDIGGGFPVCYDDVARDNIDKIGKSISKALSKYISSNTRIVAEPGRYIVAESGVMVGTVIGIADRFGKKWLHLDVGADNGLLEAVQTANTILFPVRDSRMSREKDIVVLTGPTCDSQDTILFDARVSSNLEIGDKVYFEFAGAYSTAFTECFNGFANPYIFIKNN